MKRKADKAYLKELRDQRTLLLRRNRTLHGHDKYDLDTPTEALWSMGPYHKGQIVPCIGSKIIQYIPDKTIVPGLAPNFTAYPDPVDNVIVFLTVRGVDEFPGSHSDLSSNENPSKFYRGYVAFDQNGVIYYCQRGEFDEVSNAPYSNWVRPAYEGIDYESIIEEGEEGTPEAQKVPKTTHVAITDGYPNAFLVWNLKSVSRSWIDQSSGRPYPALLQYNKRVEKMAEEDSNMREYTLRQCKKHVETLFGGKQIITPLIRRDVVHAFPYFSFEDCPVCNRPNQEHVHGPDCDHDHDEPDVA